MGGTGTLLCNVIEIPLLFSNETFPNSVATIKATLVMNIFYVGYMNKLKDN